MGKTHGIHRQPAIFICTPEIVRTWLLYPLWLHTPHAFPERIVIDRRDHRRVHLRVTRDLHKATPYDFATWLRVGDFRQTVDSSFEYEKYVHPKEITLEARNVFKEVRTRGWIPKDDLHAYMAESFHHWLFFGLEQKRRLLGGYPVYERAIEDTQSKCSAIQAGNLPFDPQLLLERHFAKLLAALKLRAAVKRKYPNKRVLVFDTGEFAFAARLLARRFQWDVSETFAVSEQIDDCFEDSIIQELSTALGLELTKPVCDPHVGDFSSAVDDLKRHLSRGKRIADLAAESDEKFRALRTRFEDCLEVITPQSPRILTNGFSLAGANSTIVEVLGLAKTMPAYSAALLVLTTLTWNVFLATECRELVTKLVPTVRLRLRLYVEKALTAGIQKWRGFLLRLSKLRSPHPRDQKEEAQRQMMSPWVKNPVWYHK